MKSSTFLQLQSGNSAA